MPSEHTYLDFLAHLIEMKQTVSRHSLGQYDLGVAPFPEERARERRRRIQRLKMLGVRAMGHDVALYVNRISPGCRLCKAGIGLTVSLTKDCNRDCFFCFSFGQTRDDLRRGITEDVDIDETIRVLEHATDAGELANVGITGGEPLLVVDRVTECIRVVKEQSAGRAEVRLYTNGDLMTADTLAALRDCGLDEIRLGMKPGEPQILEKAELAMEYVPRVLLEGPVLPEQEELVRDLLVGCEDRGIYGVNLLDLRCRRNFASFRERGYAYAYKEERPFYEPWEAQGWPIQGSEEAIFNLLEYVVCAGFEMSVHYCSVRQNIELTAANQRRRRAKERRRAYENISADGLLVKAVVGHPDCERARSTLRAEGVSEDQMATAEEGMLLETNVANARSLERGGYQTAILYTLPGGEAVAIEMLGHAPHEKAGKASQAPRTTKLDIDGSSGRALATLWLRIGECYEEMGEMEEALDYYLQALKLFPDHGTIAVRAAGIYYKLGAYDQAIGVIARGEMALPPAIDAHAHFLLALCYGRKQQYAEALRELDHLEGTDAAQAAVLLLKCECFRELEMGDHLDAEVSKLTEQIASIWRANDT